MTEKSGKKVDFLPNSLPNSAGNYWRLREEDNNQPLPAGLHNNSHQNKDQAGKKAVLLMHPNPNQKYFKRRDFLDKDKSNGGNFFRYRIREPLSPFRGLAMITFWVCFGLILFCLGGLVVTLVYVGMTSPTSTSTGDDNPHSYFNLRNSTSIILRVLFAKH
ncbi:hypothetical protein Fcan01_18322 [Folsomia candida]|uniref:Uncharacterized protein n=1 Tax=Folsomia candida TaxID=158441 RepID=A0A226DNQ1_FOLCA|nr:hypothetical protein Fcan01_18322 [Folsomia candida]